MTFLMLLISTAFAADSWFCTQDSSKTVGDSVYICGVGEGRDEPTARLNSLESAKLEFKTLCDLSSKCQSKEVTVRPQRMTCDRFENGYKCYRLIVFEMGDEKSKEKQSDDSMGRVAQAWDNDFRRQREKRDREEAEMEAENKRQQAYRNSLLSQIGFQ